MFINTYKFSYENMERTATKDDQISLTQGYAPIEKVYGRSIPAREIIKRMRDAMGLTRVVAMVGCNKGEDCIDIYVGPDEEDHVGGIRALTYFELDALGVKSLEGGRAPELKGILTNNYVLIPHTVEANNVAGDVLNYFLNWGTSFSKLRVVLKRVLNYLSKGSPR